MFKIGGGNLKRLIKMCKKQFTLNLFTSFIIRVSNIFCTFAPDFSTFLMQWACPCLIFCLEMLRRQHSRRTCP